MKNKLVSLIEKTKDKLLFVIIALVVLSFFLVHAENKFEETTEGWAPNSSVTIDSGALLEQELTDMTDGDISAINILLVTYGGRASGDMMFKFYEDDRMVESWDVPFPELKDNAYHKFEFEEPFHLSSDSVYKLQIQEQYEDENCVTIYTNPDSTDAYYVDGEFCENGSICYTLTYRNDHLHMAFIVIGILLTLVIVVLVLLQINETILMSGLLFLLMVFYMWRCPLGMVPDEDSHYLRAYEVANVSLISQHMGADGIGGNYMPGNLLCYGDKTATIDKEDDCEYIFGNTALYSPITYLPQAIGIKLAGIFSDRTSVIFYGGRFGGAAICFALCVLTLLVAPFGKRIFFLMMTFPLTIQEMISVSPDGFTIALCLFFIAYILRISYGNEKIRKRDVVILATVGLTISLCKIVYVVLMLLLFMIPGDKFSSKKKSYLFKMGLMGVAVVLNLIWLKISAGYLVEFNEGVNSFAQCKFVLTHILGYYATVVRTMLYFLFSWFQNMVGGAMGALNIQTTQIMWFMVILLLVYETCSCYENDKDVHKWDCLILIFTFLAGSALIFTSLYVQWTALESSLIEGVQGRYFIPLLGTFLFFVIFMRQNKLKEMGIVIGKRDRASYMYLILLLYNGITLLDLTNYYLI